ncbi:MAG: DUF4258 domain-containing protein [Candidatus Vogelbacteria bacterium]
MKIIFSPHAILKIEQRKLSRQLIIETIVRPNFNRPSYGLREELYREFGKNYLKVVIKRESDQIIVVTAHWVASLKNK